MAIVIDLETPRKTKADLLAQSRRMATDKSVLDLVRSGKDPAVRGQGIFHEPLPGEGEGKLLYPELDLQRRLSPWK